LDLDLDQAAFLSLSNTEFAELVRQAGSKVCVFPINGTRRWFSLEHAQHLDGDPVRAYLDITGQRHIELYRMFFEHGIDTLLTPVFGPELLGRGEAYIDQIAVEGLSRLACHPDFIRFYDEYQVKVRFYGDYRYFFAATVPQLTDLFDRIVARTANYRQHRLFFGVCAQDASRAIAEIAIAYYQKNGQPPSKEDLIVWYYGEQVNPVDFFVGFDKFSAFDMPLVQNGEEDLYFTTAPSPYLSSEQLRRILYDHLYARKTEDKNYQELSPEDRRWMHAFYGENLNQTSGIGTTRGGIWYPLPSVTWPVNTLEDSSEAII
jgi:adenosine tuberculosinyltransferase